MKTRRDFLKVLLGAALVAPAIAACRTIAPEPFDLPAKIDAKTLLAAYQKAYPDHAALWNERYFSTGQWSSSGVHPQNIRRGTYQAGSSTGRICYNRGPTAWTHSHVIVFPNRPRPEWDTAKYMK